MGGCISVIGAPQHLIDNVDGDENDYQKSYLEDVVLGEGEFGVVKMVHDVTRTFVQQNGDDNNNALQHQQQPYACKELRKGMQFKDNVLYTPLKPEILRGEIDILRTLSGTNYCLRLHAVYESAKCLYVITEYCGGGEMMEYIANLTSAGHDDMRSEDVSRMSFQLISALSHCFVHNVLHRDIKPENIMFQNPLPSSDLRLIDFGSGCMDKADSTKTAEGKSKLIRHTTFAGSAFYMSPEMFQHDYNIKTDIWSAGVLLYVLVAGYPADCLQKAFNVLQQEKRNLKTALPNLPDHMPDSFYDLLEKLLVHKRSARVTAVDLVDHEFLKFHKQMMEQPEMISLADVSSAAASPFDDGDQLTSTRRNDLRRLGSVSLKGSVMRHTAFLGFKKFERSLTTLLAAMLSKTELQTFLDALSTRATSTTDRNQAIAESNSKLLLLESKNAEVNNHQTLSVCKVSELKEVLLGLKHSDVLDTISKLPGVENYDNFAYHIELLVVFSSHEQVTGQHSTLSTSSGRRGMRPGTFKRTNSYTNNAKITGGVFLLNGSNHSTRSASSFRVNNSRKGRKTIQLVQNSNTSQKQ